MNRNLEEEHPLPLKKKEKKKEKQSRQPDAQITLGLYSGGGSSLLSYYLYYLCKSPAS